MYRYFLSQQYKILPVGQDVLFKVCNSERAEASRNILIDVSQHQSAKAAPHLSHPYLKDISV
ncbi:conserved domain protein [Actinomyces sp. oral taxon 175 str. F0384]|nr:conserved domain protein [Actinomyces sp. oral taxon 175 str. F0384]